MIPTYKVVFVRQAPQVNMLDEDLPDNITKPDLGELFIQKLKTEYKQWAGNSQIIGNIKDF